MPEASVIIPVRDRARQLRRAIGSLLHQDFADFEAIIVDDGSAEDIRAEVEAIGDARLRYLRHEGRPGSSAARNTGIRAAKADLLCFLDSDDVYLPDKIGAVVRIFRERPDLDVLVDSYILRFPPERRRSDRLRLNRPVEPEEFAEALFARQLWKATPAISVRREAALRAGLFDEELARRQDFDFLARLASRSRCAATDRILWVKSWSPASISAQMDTFIPATLQLCRHNPDYLTDTRLSRALARDLVRQLGRLAKFNGIAAAAVGLSEMVREFGLATSLKLVLMGSRELIARSRPPTPSAQPHAPTRETRPSGRGNGSKSRVMALESSPRRAVK